MVGLYNFSVNHPALAKVQQVYRRNTVYSVRPSNRSLTRRDRLIAELLVVVYVAVVAEIARFSGISYLLFPELGALAYDLLVRPWGKWASQPIRLVLTPTLTAVVGTLVTRYLPFGVWSVLLVVGISILVIASLRSWIAPAMSAGVLPLVLGVKSWMYPPGMLATLIVLATVSVIWRKYHSSRVEPGEWPEDLEDVLESPPHGKYWIAVLMGFVAMVAGVAQIPGLRLVLFPPIVTIAYEMFGHTETCPWTKRWVTLPACCFLTALSGLLAFRVAGTGLGLAVCAVATGIFVLRLFDLHMPPAMAVGLLPAVMIAPTWKFPFAVLAGTLLLTAVFLIYRRLNQRTQKVDSPLDAT
jgi:hypothetical protein